jgi:predicted neuraminidase
MTDQSSCRCDLALEPPPVILAPGCEYQSASRLWQGIPGIERAADGRLWATWYSGGEGEGPFNYVVLVTSADDGCSWSEPVLVVDPPDRVRAFDPCLWHDPLGRLWLFWAQSRELFDGRAGVWVIRCDDSRSDAPRFTAPRRLCNGVMMNKPTVLSTGEWLLPAAVWNRKPADEQARGGSPLAPPDERKANAVASMDEGKTWRLLGGADVPERSYDEHIIVERRDGSLWMLVRTSYGIGQSVSHDRGRTWSAGVPTRIKGPCSRFFVRRLASGRLLLVNHDDAKVRCRLTAWVSEDDGESWLGGLMLDERSGVSYPDGVQAQDGRIYVIYDHGRYAEKEILMAVFTEEDILARRCVSDAARLRVLVNKASV